MKQNLRLKEAAPLFISMTRISFSLHKAGTFSFLTQPMVIPVFLVFGINFQKYFSFIS
ncbi:hypothetical protein [Angelakisella massiliensis]|uniref:hypothetical protein n=1 Tax=Angelakisella massiliensis TaxID=1871018 RepID=UPI00155F3B06|nr:hypothetical protein [Angelakisella massiliensis]